jgi:hypothetical protein
MTLHAMLLLVAIVAQVAVLQSHRGRTPLQAW